MTLRTFSRSSISMGVNGMKREIERVQVAMLKLSEGKIGNLRTIVKAAKTDYRDVLGRIPGGDETSHLEDGRSGSQESKRKGPPAVYGLAESEMKGQLLSRASGWNLLKAKMLLQCAI